MEQHAQIVAFEGRITVDNSNQMREKLGCCLGWTMETVTDRVRTGRTPAELRQAILDNPYYVQGRIPELATTNDWYIAVSYAVRDRIMNDWIQAFGRARRTRSASEVSLRDLNSRIANGDENNSGLTLEEVERNHIPTTLKQTHWVVSGPRVAASRLGLNRSTAAFPDEEARNILQPGSDLASGQLGRGYARICGG
jgi:hypothetical protein